MAVAQSFFNTVMGTILSWTYTICIILAIIKFIQMILAVAGIGGGSGSWNPFTNRNTNTTTTPNQNNGGNGGSGDSDTAPNEGTLEIVVRDELFGTPIPNATVNIQEDTTLASPIINTDERTNQQGEVVMQLAPDTYSVSATAQGYHDSGEVSAHIRSNQNTQVELELLPNLQVQGRANVQNNNLNIHFWVTTP